MVNGGGRGDKICVHLETRAVYDMSRDDIRAEELEASRRERFGHLAWPHGDECISQSNILDVEMKRNLHVVRLSAIS